MLSYRRHSKPVLDFLLAAMLLFILSPVFLIVIIVLVMANRGRPFFVQPRIGKNNIVFKVIKFKTMNDRTDQQGNLLPDEKRLTAVGKFIRKTSLDELPQLINIVKGDMSFVGPRPLLVEYGSLYSPEQQRRHTVTPGITGWAQVNGRNSIAWKDKFAFDVWYVDHLSFALDMKILMRTIGKVMKAEGISGRGVATAEKFNGNN
jgi:undecaprenyl phosphate N,N'-diacetylbacillosamine 1-phosphate transferase